MTMVWMLEYNSYFIRYVCTYIHTFCVYNSTNIVMLHNMQLSKVDIYMFCIVAILVMNLYFPFIVNLSPIAIIMGLL